MPFGWIAKFFTEILWPIIKKEGWPGLFSWLFRRGPKSLRIASLVFLAISFIASFWWWWGTKDVQAFFAQTLITQLEATPQSYKGLEAFALAGLDESARKSYKDAKVTPEFAKVSTEFDHALSTGTTTMPALQVIWPDPTRHGLAQAYVSDYLARDSRHAFLFVPAMILRTLPAAGLTDGEITQAAIHDPQVSAEIRASAAAAEKICSFQGTALYGGEKPVQSYFITRTGLMRVCEYNIINQETYYKGQFLPNTFFPDRPYFSATIDNFPTPAPAQTGQPVESLSITKPYIDLGGNGVVVTMSLRTKAPRIAESGLFLDISMGAVAKTFITNKVKTFGGSATPITCNGEASISCGRQTNDTANSESMSDEKLASLNHEISGYNSPAQLSEIFGKIHVFKSDEPQQIIFTIPLARDFASPGSQHVLLYCTFDLQKLRFWNAAKAAVAGGSFLLFLFLVGAVIADFGLQLRGQDRAFTTFARVMGMAPIAYCR